MICLVPFYGNPQIVARKISLQFLRTLSLRNGLAIATQAQKMQSWHSPFEIFSHIISTPAAISRWLSQLVINQPGGFIEWLASYKRPVPSLPRCYGSSFAGDSGLQQIPTISVTMLMLSHVIRADERTKGCQVYNSEAKKPHNWMHKSKNELSPCDFWWGMSRQAAHRSELYNCGLKR